MELIVNRLSRKEIQSKKRVGSGMYSEVYNTQEGVAVKLIDDFRLSQWITEKERYDEIQTLKDLTGCGVTPYFFSYEPLEHAIYMEYIDGECTEIDWLQYKSKHFLNQFWKKLEGALLHVVSFGYMPADLHSGNMIYSEGNIILIDLGRYVKVDKLMRLHGEYSNKKELYLPQINIMHESIGRSNTKGDLLIPRNKYDEVLKNVNEAIHRKVSEVLGYAEPISQ